MSASTELLPTRASLAAHVLAALMLGLAFLLVPPSALQRFWLDLQLRIATPTQAPQGVLVYDIDEASLAALRSDFGTWPLGRDSYALVVEALRDAGVKAIALDLLLADVRDGDAALARAIARPGAPVLLAAAGLPGPRGQPGWTQLLRPAPSLGEGAAAPRQGLITLPLDPDGRLRHWPLRQQVLGAEPMPLLALALLEALDELPRLRADDTGRVTPLLGAPAATLPFSALAQAARANRMDDPVLRAARDQVVFIGTSSQLADLVITPWGQQSGTALLAQAYAALRDGHGLAPLSPLAQLGLIGLGLLPALLVLRRPRLRLQLMSSALVVGLLGLLLLLAPREGGVWIDPSGALAMLVLGSLLHMGWQQRRVQVEVIQQTRQRELAQAANQAKSLFLANISHELRTPLSALLGLSELLAQGQLEPGQRRQVQLLGSAGRSLMTLVDELLDLGRIETGQLRLHAGPTQLPRLLDDVVALLRGRADANQVRCELVVQADVHEWVEVDGARLQQVLLNLIGNAIRFTPRGRVSLHVHRLDSGRLQFAVSDTGIGIASSQLQRIFEPFVQSQGQEHARFGGTGLGLAISRQLVRLMGGEIEVQSVPGAGSRFAFALPLPRVETPPAMRPTDAPLTPGLQLLMAEDDEVVAEVLRAQLQPAVEASGLRIERAGSGHLALALAKRLRFDIVLLDLQLPGLDGLRVVRELREFEAREGRPRVPVLALSSHAQVEDAEASLAAGCDEHLSKPLSQQRLLQALARWAPSEASGEMPPPHEPPLDDMAAKRRDHALVFLGRWHEAWAEARTEKSSALALLRDLLDCADALSALRLREAAASLLALLELPVARMLHQHQREQAVLAEVEDTLIALRPPT